MTADRTAVSAHQVREWAAEDLLEAARHGAGPETLKLLADDYFNACDAEDEEERQA